MTVFRASSPDFQSVAIFESFVHSMFTQSLYGKLSMHVFLSVIKMISQFKNHSFKNYIAYIINYII